METVCVQNVQVCRETLSTQVNNLSKTNTSCNIHYRLVCRGEKSHKFKFHVTGAQHTFLLIQTFCMC